MKWNMICIVIFVSFISYLMLIPDSVREHSLDIRITAMTSGGQDNSCLIVISNVSKKAVKYNASDDIYFAFCKNGVWETNDIDEFFIDNVLLKPGGVDKYPNCVKIPVNATAIKAGVSYEIVTWKAAFSWKNIHSFLSSKGSAFYYEIDKKNRSITEWSDVWVFNAK